MNIDSLNYFGGHWIIWKWLGYGSNFSNWKPLLIGYIVVLHLVFNMGYSFHLGMSIFRNENFTDDIKNLTTFAVCFAGTLKSFVYAFNFYKIHRMEEMIKVLDLRVSGNCETNIYVHMRTQLRNILYGFIGIYMTVGIFAELSFLFQTKRGLMYPAWFPFDWCKSTRNFYIAHVYQIVGIAYHLVQNYVFDCYPAMILCIISSHIQMLYVRFEQIGLNDPRDAEAQNQLEACINDHKCLLELVEN